MPEPIGRVKACTVCRQQKVRCDAYKDYTRPCTRCRAAQLPCIISKEFKRRKRQTKAQLQYELDRLRDDAHEVKHDDGLLGPAAPRPMPDSNREALRPNETTDTTPDGTASSHVSRGENPILHENHDASVQGHDGTPLSGHSFSNPSEEETKPRVLDGVEMSGSAIDDCYHLFLANYAPFLDGIFEQIVTPNNRYEQCPTLFWAMICIGARRYPKDMEISSRLQEPVYDLMFQSFRRQPQPLLVIIAALVLCNWPLTIDLVYKDPSQTLAGAAMNFAIQQGLHMYYHENDFTAKTIQRTAEPFPNPEIMSSAMLKAIKMRDAALVFRTRVWAYCQIVFQSTSLCDGLPTTALVPCFRKPEIYGEMGNLLPDALGYRLRLNKIQTTATNIISDQCDLDGRGGQSYLNAMIASFDENVCNTPMPYKSRRYHWIRTAARLVIHGLYFVVQTEPDHTSMAKLYQIVREYIDHEKYLDVEIKDFTCHMPQYYYRLTYYSLHCLTRIYKSPLGQKLDRREAEECLSSGVEILRNRRENRNHGLSYQVVTVLMQLWGSEKAFVRNENEPQNGLRVDLRHRLMLNPLFDSFWWWRREFGTTAECDANAPSKERNPKPLDIVPAPGRPVDYGVSALPPGQGSWNDTFARDSMLPGFVDWDFTAMSSDLNDLNAWLGSIDENGPLEYQPWEMSTGPL